MKKINTMVDGEVYELNGSTLVKIGKDVEIQQDTWNKKGKHEVTLSIKELKEIVKKL